MSKLVKISLTETSLEYKWIIDDVPQVGVESPTFPNDAETISCGAQWCIELKVINSWIHLTLWGLTKSSVPLCVSCTLATLTEHGHVIDSNSFTRKLSPSTEWTEFRNCDFDQAPKETSDNHQQTIRCTIEIHDEGKVSPIRYEIPQCDLWQSFETLLTTGENADVSLVVGDQQIKAHRVILMARSPVFKAMFNSQMAESVQNLVKIDDVDLVVLEELLGFVYTGKAPNLSKMANRLLIAAGKYDLPRLQAMCEKELGHNLTVENAAQTLVVAELYGASQLRKHALWFIKGHASQVFDTEGWKEMVPKYPFLLDAVCRELVS